MLPLSPQFIEISALVTYSVAATVMCFVVNRKLNKLEELENRVTEIELEREQELKFMEKPNKPLTYTWADLYNSRKGK